MPSYALFGACAQTGGPIAQALHVHAAGYDDGSAQTLAAMKTGFSVS
jgi:hypothetical protein